MAKITAEKWETFMENWNNDFPDYQLTVDELNKTLSLMGAVFQVFDRLGIDREAVLMPPSEKNLNNHVQYYYDLIPVINMTRVVNHLLQLSQMAGYISVYHFLQPSTTTAYSVLKFLCNLMVFYEQKLKEISPYEDELFNVTNMVKTLEEKKNKLYEMLNRQAEEKGARAQRMEKAAQEICQLEEELQAEEHLRDQEKKELDVLIKENNATETMSEQKRATKEGLMAELERKQALRVYDAEDIKTQAAQAARNVQEAEEKLHSLGEIITKKENSLKILHMIKPNLDTANNLLHEITKLKDYEVGDLDMDSKDGELEVLNTELMELRALEADLRTRREEACRKRQEGQAKRQQDRTVTESAVREAEEKDKKCRESAVRAVQRTHEIKLSTLQYEQRKAKGFDTIQHIKEEHTNAVKAWEEALMKLVNDVKADIESKRRSLEQ